MLKGHSVYCVPWNHFLIKRVKISTKGFFFPLGLPGWCWMWKTTQRSSWGLPFQNIYPLAVHMKYIPWICKTFHQSSQVTIIVMETLHRPSSSSCTSGWNNKEALCLLVTLERVLTLSLKQNPAAGGAVWEIQETGSVIEMCVACLVIRLHGEMWK